MSDLDRLRLEYADREARFASDDRYSLTNPAYRFLKTQLHSSVQAVLRRKLQVSLADCRLLEVGCGNGNVLMDYQQMGACHENIAGVDLLPGRLRQAHGEHPSFSFVCADAQDLPFHPGSFDLLLQYTVFSSILDAAIKSNLAGEMLRVLDAGGLILWYDFWLNPSNRQTRGIRPAEIRQLFPGCSYEFHRITLAPPIARRLATFSWGLCSFLESLKIFNTHYLAAITQKETLPGGDPGRAGKGSGRGL